MSDTIGLYNYWIAIVIMMIGFYGVIAKQNLVKQAIALGLFQTGVFLFYVSMAVYRAKDGTSGVAPIWKAVGDGSEKFAGPYDNPLPHVLMLTAIVVSVSTLAVALAIIMNIKRLYGTVEADEIAELEGNHDIEQVGWITWPEYLRRKSLPTSGHDVASTSGAAPVPPASAEKGGHA